ncbi:MAG: hypothetical protein AABN33_01610 [Acidobacteriota bacterium]
MRPGDEAVATVLAALGNALVQTGRVDLSWVHPLPPWSLSIDALQLLVSLVKHLQPAHILEFGSGVSTQVLAIEVELLEGFTKGMATIIVREINTK